MAYSVYIDGVLLPITPSKIVMKINNKNETASLINEGEINILKSAGLTDITVDAIIPQTLFPFANYTGGFKPADYYLNRFEKLKAGKKKFRFICTRSMQSGKRLYSTNMRVALEDYQINEDAKEGTNILVTLKMRQYKAYGTKTVNIQVEQPKPGKPRPADNPPSQKTYSVVKGDCLWNIAKKYLGNGARYTEIKRINGLSSDLIHPGDVLKLP